jgi:protein-S-isoprenylcysteine O-methyltransferase Ste14
MNRLSELLFTADVIILMVLLVGTVWSVAFPEKRIWPPPRKRSWQYLLAWACFYSVLALNTALFVLDWNSWIFSNELRLIVGIPVALIGGLLVSWGVWTLGVRNTSGLKEQFVASGPYRFTRNPQYLGDMMLFFGISVIANSQLLWLTHALIIFIFAAAPLAEEPWLEEQYGDAYEEYKRGTSRFL